MVEFTDLTSNDGIEYKECTTVSLSFHASPLISYLPRYSQKAIGVRVLTIDFYFPSICVYICLLKQQLFHVPDILFSIHFFYLAPSMICCCLPLVFNPPLTSYLVICGSFVGHWGNVVLELVFI